MAEASSSTSTAGFMASTPAMATRCFCPPDRACVSCRSKPESPTSSSACVTRLRSSSVGTPRFSGPKATSSSTSEATSWSSGFWNTMPTVSRMRYVQSASAVAMPCTFTVPSSGMSRAFRCLASVDLPLPLPPKMHRNSPLRTCRLTPSRAKFAPS